MGLKQDLEDLKKSYEEEKEMKKTKKFRLPFKAKVSKKRMREGYVTVMVINENKNVDFTREPIKDATYNLGDTFHATNSEDVLFYKGRPLVIQPKKKLNPYNPLQGKNETYGQKYVMARMEGDKLTLKKKIGWGMSIGLLIIAGIVAYAFITGA
ncbi:hypothetical protein LCGC14_0509510 [marine sediment metagenome]|uniref:Uncharacterized protein n=1 Tax=marine sediment metagenome TaxID=412755 RepID=A0A0F9S1R3_9ZZZZ|nr:hypothetical protein [bacterium]